MYSIHSDRAGEGGGGPELGLRDLLHYVRKLSLFPATLFNATIQLSYATLSCATVYAMIRYDTLRYATLHPTICSMISYATIRYDMQYFYLSRYIVVELCDASLSSKAHIHICAYIYAYICAVLDSEASHSSTTICIT